MYETTLLNPKPQIEPRLLAVRGPLKGHVLPLPEGEYCVGRQAINDLQLEDNAVSRRHCLFTRSGDDCILKDLESRNGTFVSGTPVTEQQLEPGDEIRIGESVFCYLVDPGAVPVIADQSSVSSTRELRIEESIYLSSDEYAILPPSARALHDLRTLLRVSTMLHSFRGLHDTTSASAAEVLRGHLTSLLLDLVPASRAAIFIPGARPGAVPDHAPANPLLLERAIQERVVVWQEADESSDHSVLAAPLIVRGEVAAVVYLESEGSEHRFDEGHLQLLTAVAGMAAVAWENATILGWLQEENERLQTELKLEHA
ncbi:MAG: FHA domain-containing protein, partial [Bryobacterales bacterium]|nr:FHA domain-containing protein [Bryobacterales bacterium]